MHRVHETIPSAWIYSSAQVTNLETWWEYIRAYAAQDRAGRDNVKELTHPNAPCPRNNSFNLNIQIRKSQDAGADR